MLCGSPAAAEYGYEVTGDDLDELKNKAAEEMSEDI